MHTVGNSKALIALVSAALIIAVAIFGPWLWRGTAPSPPQPDFDPRGWLGQNRDRVVVAPTPTSGDCITDPASLPPPPSGPNGERAVYVHTCGNRLYDADGREVRIAGLNWFGLETGTYSPHGLWTRNWQSMLDQVARLRYNAIRLPYSNEMLLPGREPQGINYAVNPDLQGLTPLEVMDRIVEGAGRRGLKVILDRHRPTSAAQSALWYTEDVSEDQWISDWRMLAQRYLGDDTVIGVDLHNEPRGEATWGTGDLATDWRLAAERGGNAILEVNPYLLIIVQGIEQYDGDWYWWGGNLKGAGENPVRLNVPGRLVYSAHDYGPDVYPQGWFSDPAFPGNMPQVWDEHWAYLSRQGIAPVLLGEFGGRSVDEEDAEGKWQRSLLDFIHTQGLSYFNWSLNPNSTDTGGLLDEDWLNLMQDKYSVYKQYLQPPIVDTGVRHFGPPPALPRVLYRVGEASGRSSSVSFSLQVINDGGEPIDLSHVRLRYWFSHGQSRSSTPIAEVDWAALGAGAVKAELVKIDRAGQDHYLELSFAPTSQPLSPYGSTGDILVRIHSSDWTEYDQTNDYSFSGQSFDYQASDHVTVYIDDRLVWGQEP